MLHEPVVGVRPHAMTINAAYRDGLRRLAVLMPRDEAASAARQPSGSR